MNGTLWILLRISIFVLILSSACSQQPAQPAAESALAGLPAGSYLETCVGCSFFENLPGIPFCCSACANGRWFDPFARYACTSPGPFRGCYNANSCINPSSCVPIDQEIGNRNGNLVCVESSIPTSICQGKPVWFVTSKKYTIGVPPFTNFQVTGGQAIKLDDLNAECAAQAASFKTPVLRRPIAWKAIILAGDADGRYTADSIKANQFEWDQQATFCPIPRTAVDPVNCQNRVILSDGSVVPEGERLWLGFNYGTSGPRCNPPQAALPISVGQVFAVCGVWNSPTSSRGPVVMLAPSMGLATGSCSESLRLLCAAQF